MRSETHSIAAAPRGFAERALHANTEKWWRTCVETGVANMFMQSRFADRFERARSKSQCRS
eukprot:3625219-Lingulodinium_polyedra.AAC.1